MRQTEIAIPTVAGPDKPGKRFVPRWLNFSPLDGILLATALIAAYLPLDWTRDLKRIKQAPLYSWLGLGYFLVYALAVLWAFRPASQEIRYRHKWLALIGLVLIPNLFNIWLRTSAKLANGSLLFGQDADMGLFFKYGQDLVQGLNPTNTAGQYAEYPQFALLLFGLSYWLSGNQLASFNFVLPALISLFQLVAALAVYGCGRKLGRARAGFLVAAFVVGCPALFGFNATRFDAAPAALLVLAVYFYLPSPGKTPDAKEPGGAGLAVAAGGLIKWLPFVIAPWLVMGYLQARRWRQLLIFGLASLSLSLITLMPFYLWNSEAFWYPYKFQGSRKLIGESFWFLVQRDFLDPAHTTPEKPWGEPALILLGNNKLLALQLGLTFLIFALTFLRFTKKSRQPSPTALLTGGLVGVAVFTLANRVFSPQYLVLLAWAWAMALVLGSPGRFKLLAGLALISIAAAANFQVYLLGVYPEEWVRDSWIMFGSAWLLCGGLLGFSIFGSYTVDKS